MELTKSHRLKKITLIKLILKPNTLEKQNSTLKIIYGIISRLFLTCFCLSLKFANSNQYINKYNNLHNLAHQVKRLQIKYCVLTC